MSHRKHSKRQTICNIILKSVLLLNKLYKYGANIEKRAVIACTIEILPNELRYVEEFKRYVESISENVILAYFRDQSIKLKSSNNSWCY